VGHDCGMDRGEAKDCLTQIEEKHVEDAAMAYIAYISRFQISVLQGRVSRLPRELQIFHLHLGLLQQSKSQNRNK
jgi:hypothetical protein